MWQQAVQKMKWQVPKDHGLALEPREPFHEHHFSNTPLSPTTITNKFMSLNYYYCWFGTAHEGNNRWPDAQLCSISCTSSANVWLNLGVKERKQKV